MNEVGSDIALYFERCPKVFVTVFRSWELETTEKLLNLVVISIGQKVC